MGSMYIFPNHKDFFFLSIITQNLWCLLDMETFAVATILRKLPGEMGIRDRERQTPHPRESAPLMMVITKGHSVD